MFATDQGIDGQSKPEVWFFGQNRSDENNVQLRIARTPYGIAVNDGSRQRYSECEFGGSALIATQLEQLLCQ